MALTTEVLPSYQKRQPLLAARLIALSQLLHIISFAGSSVVDMAYMEAIRYEQGAQWYQNVVAEQERYHSFDQHLRSSSVVEFINKRLVQVNTPYPPAGYNVFGEAIKEKARLAQRQPFLSGLDSPFDLPLRRQLIDDYKQNGFIVVTPDQARKVQQVEGVSLETNLFLQATALGNQVDSMTTTAYLPYSSNPNLSDPFVGAKARGVEVNPSALQKVMTLLITPSAFQETTVSTMTWEKSGLTGDSNSEDTFVLKMVDKPELEANPEEIRISLRNTGHLVVERRRLSGQKISE